MRLATRILSWMLKAIVDGFDGVERGEGMARGGLCAEARI